VLGINYLTRVKPNAKRPTSDRLKIKGKASKDGKFPCENCGKDVMEGWSACPVCSNFIGEAPRYSSVEEVYMAVEAKALEWEAVIKVKPPKSPIWVKTGRKAEPGEDGLIETTAGRLMFNEEMPPEIPFINYELKDKELRSLIENVFANKGSWTTVKMLDAIKATGYKYATVFGSTIGVDDIVVPKEKQGMIEKANKEVEAIQKLFNNSMITAEERYNRVIEVWQKTNEGLTNI